MSAATMTYQFVDVNDGAVLFVRTGVLDSRIVETVQLVHDLVHLEQGDTIMKNVQREHQVSLQAVSVMHTALYACETRARCLTLPLPTYYNPRHLMARPCDK